MIEIQGYWWPDDVAEKWQHSLDHLNSLEVGLKHCTARRTVVQAGGNIGLWPRRLGEVFDRVFTFEPDAPSLACLKRNVAIHGDRVRVSAAALGEANGAACCSIKHKSLGSHRVVEGAGDIPIVPIDILNLFDVDFIQLDLEGYEHHALLGAVKTIQRSHPVIQLELRGFTRHFGRTDESIRSFLFDHGYRQVATAPGSDFIFRWKGGR